MQCMPGHSGVKPQQPKHTLQIAFLQVAFLQLGRLLDFGAWLDSDRMLLCGLRRGARAVSMHPSIVACDSASHDMLSDYLQPVLQSAHSGVLYLTPLHWTHVLLSSGRFGCHWSHQRVPQVGLCRLQCCISRGSHTSLHKSCAPVLVGGAMVLLPLLGCTRFPLTHGPSCVARLSETLLHVASSP